MSNRKRQTGSDPLSSKYRSDYFDLTKELSLLIRAGYSLVYLDTTEEERAEILLKHLSDDLGLPFFFWTPTKGLQRSDFGETIYGTTDIRVALSHIETSEFSAIYHLQSAGPYISEHVVGAKLTQAVRLFTKIEGALVLTGKDVKIPASSQPHTAFLKLPSPERQDYADLLRVIYKDVSARMRIQL